MKNFIIYVVFALLYLTIEHTLIHIFLPSSFIPDVPLIIVLYIGFTRASIEGVITVFAIGYAADVFAAGIIGTSSFTFTLVFIVSHFLSRKVSLTSNITKMGGAALLAVMKGIVMYTLVRILKQPIPFYIIFTTALSTGIFSPFIIMLIRKVESYFIPFQREDRLINP